MIKNSFKYINVFFLILIFSCQPIDKVENATISKESKDYKKYLNLSKAKMITNLYAAYDSHLRKKYKVEINYNAFDNLKKNIK